MTFPTDKFRRLGISQEAEVRLSDKSRYYRNRKRTGKEPFWRITATTPPLKYDEAVGVAAYLDALMGAFTVFDLPNPFPSLVEHSGLLCQFSFVKGADAITCKGLPANMPNAIRAGDFIQFGTHSKVYRVTANDNANATGNASIYLTPPLLQAVSTNDTILYGSDVVFNVCLSSKSEMEIDAGKGKDAIVIDVELDEQG